MSGRVRLGWALVASATVHVAVALVVTLLAARSDESPKTLVVKSSQIHIVHRAAKRRSESSYPPHRPYLTAPQGWRTQDIGFEGQSDVTLWLDWKNQTSNFVPRVFLWQRRAVTPEMRNETLRHAVAEILDLLRSEKDELYVSRPQLVCDGTRSGWFFSYVKPWDDPPLRYEETIYVQGDAIDRATYSRAAGQPEDPNAREALNSLC